MKKVLIIDDDEGILEALKATIEMFGYEAKTNTKGEMVIQLIKQFEPNVVLLDVLLSGYDGRTITQEIRKHDKISAIPIILMSAHPSAAKEYKNFGATDFLSKPFNVDELLAKIKEYSH